MSTNQHLLRKVRLFLFFFLCSCFGFGFFLYFDHRVSAVEERASVGGRASTVVAEDHAGIGKPLADRVSALEVDMLRQRRALSAVDVQVRQFDVLFTNLQSDLDALGAFSEVPVEQNDGFLLIYD